jgi:hypothetical protein
MKADCNRGREWTRAFSFISSDCSRFYLMVFDNQRTIMWVNLKGTKRKRDLHMVYYCIPSPRSNALPEERRFIAMQCNAECVLSASGVANALQSNS